MPEVPVPLLAPARRTRHVAVKAAKHNSVSVTAQEVRDLAHAKEIGFLDHYENFPHAHEEEFTGKRKNQADLRATWLRHVINA